LSGNRLNFSSFALFCILEVWQGFIRTVVQRLLSRGTNFHSNKHVRNYTQDGLQSKIGNCAACCKLSLKLKNLNETNNKSKLHSGDQGIRVTSLGMVDGCLSFELSERNATLKTSRTES